jgi:hypothetical protein
LSPLLPSLKIALLERRFPDAEEVLPELEELELPELEDDDELPDDVEVLPISLLMAANVFLPASPSTVRPLACWKLRTALSVTEP